MARPKYETGRDRARERAVLDILEEAWGVTCTQAPDFTAYDAIVRKDGEIMAAVEIKCREMSIGTYPHLIISKAKLDKLVKVTRPKYKPLLVVSLWDKVLGLEVDTSRYAVGRGGRTDRNDPADLEPVYEISWVEFNIIKRKA